MSVLGGRYSAGSGHDHRRNSLFVTPQKRGNAGLNYSTTSQEFLELLRIQSRESKALTASIPLPPTEREPASKKPRVASRAPNQFRHSLSSSGLPRIPLHENSSFNEKVRASLDANSEFFKKSTRFDASVQSPLLQPLGLKTPAGKSRYRNSLGGQPKSALKGQTPMTRRRARRQVGFFQGTNGQPYHAIEYYTPVSERSSGPTPDTTMVLDNTSPLQSRGIISNPTNENLDGANDISGETERPDPAGHRPASIIQRIFSHLPWPFSPSRPRAFLGSQPSHPEATQSQPPLPPSSPNRRSSSSWSYIWSPFKSRPSSDLSTGNPRVIETSDSDTKLSFESRIGLVEGGGRLSEEGIKSEPLVKVENGPVVRKPKGKAVEKLSKTEFSDDELGGPGVAGPRKPARAVDSKKAVEQPAITIKHEIRGDSKKTVGQSTPTIKHEIRDLGSRRFSNSPSSLKDPDPELEKDLMERPKIHMTFRPKVEPSNPKIPPPATVESPKQRLSKSRLDKRQVKEDAARRKLEEERRRAAAKEAARRKKIIDGPLEIPDKVQIQPLSAAWEEQLIKKMDTRPTTVLAKSPRGDDITRYAFGRVCPQPRSRDDSHWLNDVVIDSYLQHLSRFANGEIENSKRLKIPRGSVPRVHCFNSFFWKKIRNASSGEPLTSANTWARKANIGTWDKLKHVEWVFIPVNENDVHWTLLVVSPLYKRIEHFDSFGGGPGKFVNAAKAWVESEYALSVKAREQQGQDQGLDGNEDGTDKIDFRDWHIGEGVTEQQNNGSDCGMFTIMNARMLALGWRPAESFGPREMPLARRRVLCELLNGGLFGDFKPIDNAEDPFDWDVNNLVAEEDVVDEDEDEDGESDEE